MWMSIRSSSGPLILAMYRSICGGVAVAVAARIVAVAARARIERRDQHEVGGKRRADVSAREIVTTPSSSGCRSTSSVRRLNSGNSSRNSTPLCERLISPGAGVLPPPTRPASLIVWCGERNGRRGQQRLAGRQAGPARCRCASSRSTRVAVSGGRIVGNALGQHRLAGAGRAEHQQVVRAGGGDHQRPLGHFLAAHVGSSRRRSARAC